jgi:plastocyanin
MKKAIAAIVVVILIAGGIALALNSGSKDDSMDSMDSMKSNSSSSSSGDSGKAVSTDAVKIDNFSFSPATITVKKGTKVTWTNNDSTTHTVFETDGKTGPKSDRLNQGDSYSFTYDTAGTFKYICGIHPDMKGTVVVTE